MSKNIKGKNIDINLNITQAGTFNADIFNAYSDFTLNGSSIVARIASNEADIISDEARITANEVFLFALDATKQDNLTIQQTISASSTAIASSNAIIAYVAGSTPSISATFPLQYVAGVISGTFNSVASAGSNAFLSSGTIYNALQGKQNSLVIQQSISPSATQICSADAILAYVNLSNVIGATAPLNYVNRIISGTFDSVPTSSSNNFVSSGSLFSTFSTYQPLITQFSVINCADIFSGSLTLTAGINSILGLTTLNGTIESTNGIIQGQTIRQAGVDLLNAINTKQDILTIQQTISASSTAVASSDAIIAYVASSTPSITATFPLNYVAGVISGTFNSVASAGSNAFLSSGVIYNALATKQNSLVIQSSVSPSATQICSADAIIQYVSTNLASKQDTIDATTNIDCGSIACFNNIEIDTGDLIVYSGTISGDISPNLQAGAGISLSTTAGLTTINNIGQISSSTQYAFQATSNFNNNQSLSVGVIAMFNLVEVDTQNNFNTSNYRYTCAVSGIYTFGVKGFINTITGNFRLAIFKNAGTLLAMGGASSEASEGFDVVCAMNAGDEVYISAVTGSCLIYMASQHSWFYGYLLQPLNNSVSSSTSLTTADITTNGDINIQGFNLRNTNSALLLNGTTARIDCDSIVIQNQIASSGSIVATTQITSSGGNIVATTGDIIGVNVLAGTTNLLTEINTKQDTITTSTDLAINNLTTAGTIVSTGDIECSATITAVNGSVVSVNGDVISNVGDVRGVNVIASGINLLTEINTKQETLSAGIGIVLTPNTPSAGITEVSWSAPAPTFIYCGIGANVFMSGTIFTLNPTTITGGTGYTKVGGVITVATAGYYRISAQMNWYNNQSPRASGELAVLINNVEFGQYPKGYAYCRGLEGRHGSSGFSDWIILLGAGDNIRCNFSAAYGTASTFNGNLNALICLAGSYISISKI